MATVLRTDLEVINARSFIDMLDSVPSIAHRLYIGISRSTAWSNELIPPTPEDTADDNTDFWDELMGVQLIDNTDIRFVVPRITWTVGTEYYEFDTTSDTAFNDDFYVITSNLEVYKVASKTGVNPIVVTEPAGHNNGSPIDTGDGYTWQFMYKVAQADSDDMMTDNWMIVNWDTSDVVSDQYNYGDVNAYKTLGAKYVMVRAFLDDTGLPIVSTTYRQLGLIVDPEVSAGVPLTATNALPAGVLDYSGTLIYLENRTPITRATGQSETVKLTVEF